MRKILCFLFAIAILLTFGANAPTDAAEPYTIQKGDTLWDISGDKLNDKFLWPNLWRVNPQIENPDLIYPGDVIMIPSFEELMRMLGMGEEEIAVTGPAITEEAEEKPKEYIVNKQRFISSGWISPDYPAIGEIIEAPRNASMFGMLDLVYLKADRNISVGDKFFSIRKIKRVHHPVKKYFLGYQIRVTGILDVVGMDGRNYDVPKARVAESFEEVQIGDGLLPYEEMEPPVVPEIARTPILDGYIVESYTNSTLVSEGDIVYLDKGGDDSISVGDTFSALIQTPFERTVGKIQVFTLQPETSVALVLKSEEEISVGDTWGNR
jgi:hypothetical protein